MLCQGNVDVASGKVELSMVSTAVLHIGRLLSFPPLHLDFCLTTDTAEGRRFRCWGTRTQKATGFSRYAAWKTTAGLHIKFRLGSTRSGADQAVLLAGPISGLTGDFFAAAFMGFRGAAQLANTLHQAHRTPAMKNGLQSCHGSQCRLPCKLPLI
jgi:hypothetical protein